MASNKPITRKRLTKALPKKVKAKETPVLTEAVKYDSDKIRMDLIPTVAEVEIAKVFTHGAKKYSDWNWAEGLDRNRLEAALKRHLAQWKLGEVNDPESGLPHLAHAGCCVMMLLETCYMDLDAKSSKGTDTPDHYQKFNPKPFDDNGY